MNRGSQLSLDLPVRVAREREDFFVADSNAEAVEWVDRWPDWPTRALAIHGPPACGKTHLAHVWRTRSGAKPVELAQLSRRTLPSGLGQGVVAEYAGGAVDEVALLHLYNAVLQSDGWLLVTARQPPAQWPISLPDLRSRLRAITAVAIQAPNDELLAAVMAKLFSDRQLAVTPDLIEYAIARIERSFEAVHRFVEQIDQASLDNQRSITVRLASRLLQDEGA